MPAQQHMERAILADLRPTQMTVGLAEVAAKRAQWARLIPEAREKLLQSHWFPAVRGPSGRFYIVDHHHLGQALSEEAQQDVWVMQLADYSSIASDLFWRVMEFHHWAHPYDEKGRRCDYSAIPKRLGKLKDDPFRSLAGEVRKAGGYAKDAAPFTEFLWADFFRPQFDKKQLAAADGPGLSVEAVSQAVVLARSPAAQFLPGWSGTAASTEPVAGSLRRKK
ncbi:MAG: ParB-like protein [Comamonas sp.]